MKRCKRDIGLGKDGFTLMEMLIVVAIIAVLVAIAIPIFNAQLENSRMAADTANIRSAHSMAAAAEAADSITIDGKDYTVAAAAAAAKTKVGAWPMIYFTTDGTFSFASGKAYVIQAKSFSYKGSTEATDQYAKGEHLGVVFYTDKKPIKLIVLSY